MEIPGLRPLYNWTMELAAHRHAAWALFIIAFAESSFFPIPPDVLLIAMVLAARQKAWWLATICTAGSVFGAMAGYAIGHYFFEGIGQPIMAMYGAMDKFAEVQAAYNEHGMWFVAAGAFTPLPYKVVTIASGVFAYDFWSFVLTSIVGRGARFFLVAALLWKFGPPMKIFIEKHLGWLTILFFVLLIGAFVALSYML